LLGGSIVKWIELHNVEFGDCTVLRGDNQAFIIDCGSLNTVLNKGNCTFKDYVNAFAEHYGFIRKKYGLISHFHKDHVCGFTEILRENPQFFERIYLPSAPQDDCGNPLLLEFALLVYTFVTEKSDYCELVDNIVTAFSRIGTLSGTACMATLCQGDTFVFDDVTYEVLWPQQTEYPFSSQFYELVEQANQLLTTTWGNQAELFLQYKDTFCDCYLRCIDLFSLYSTATPTEKSEAITDLKWVLEQIDDLIYDLNGLPVAQDVAELVGSQKARIYFAKELNGASVVFQNVQQTEWLYPKHTRQDLLFTGDATPKTMAQISELLHAHYYAVKAPHHGTESEWWDGWRNIEIDHILISNGHHAAGGMISAKYAQLPAIKHCTNCTRCHWFAETGKCCNYKKRCAENEHWLRKVKKCPANQRGETDVQRGCHIYTTGPAGIYACDCQKQLEEKTSW